jgi:uncharacterized protein
MLRNWKRYAKISRRRFLQGAAVTGGVGLAAGFYTWRVEPHWLQIVERDLPVAHLPSGLEGVRLAQLSDLHIGPDVDDSYMLEVFARVRAIAPEIVVYTGDFISYDTNIFEHARRMLAELPTGKRATFGVLGNHDYGLGWSQAEVADAVAASAHSAGVQILRNQIGRVDGLQVVGIDDAWSGRINVAAALANWDATRAAIALSHNPDSADRTDWGNYAGWILSGHTHGGQCKAPFLPPPLLPVRNRRYTSGEFQLAGGRRMYINRGVGHLMRVRFNARPEVTLFRLTNATAYSERSGSRLT